MCGFQKIIATTDMDLFVNTLIHVCWLFFCRVHPSKDWVQSLIPEIVRNCVEGLEDDANDIDDMDAEAFIQAYVNIVAGACISLGNMLFAVFVMNLTIVLNISLII